MIYLKACPNCLGGDVESSVYDNSMKCLQCSWEPKPSPMPVREDNRQLKYG